MGSAPGFNMGGAAKGPHAVIGPNGKPISSPYFRGNQAPPAPKGSRGSGRLAREAAGFINNRMGQPGEATASVVADEAYQWAKTPSASASKFTQMEQRLSGEGMDTLYARGGATSMLPIKSSNFHIQGGGDGFAQRQHLVSNRVDPTIPQEGMTPMAAPSPYREARSPAFPTMGQQQPAVDMRGPMAATDFLHRQSTAGAGGNMWLGEDAQHATLTMGIDPNPVRPIRRMAD